MTQLQTISKREVSINTIPTDPRENWRDRALSESLRKARDGSSVGRLIQEIRRRRGGCAITVLSLDRAQIMRFMDGFQSNEGILIIASSNHPG